VEIRDLKVQVAKIQAEFERQKSEDKQEIEALEERYKELKETESKLLTVRFVFCAFPLTF